MGEFGVRSLNGLGVHPLNERLALGDNLGFPPCWRAYFLLRRQKKVAKEKATPGYAVGCANFPALLAGPGGCGTRGCAPQTVLADCPRPRSVARRSARGPKNGPWFAVVRGDDCCDELGEEALGKDCFPLNERLELFYNLGFPPCWRAYFLLRGQKKVAKEKATPGSAPGKPGPFRYSAARAACLNSPAAQTRQAEPSRPACVAQRLPRGPKNGARPTIPRNKYLCAKPGIEAKTERKIKETDHSLSMDAFPGPLGGAEQRRCERKRGEDCLRAQPEFRSPRSRRVAQGTGAAGTDPGVAFSLATFFWPRKRKYARQQGGNPR